MTSGVGISHIHQRTGEGGIYKVIREKVGVGIEGSVISSGDAVIDFI